MEPMFQVSRTAMQDRARQMTALREENARLRGENEHLKAALSGIRAISRGPGSDAGRLAEIGAECDAVLDGYAGRCTHPPV
jgi:hypothetical protein